MAGNTTTTTTKTATPKLWKIDCAPECGFSVRNHNEKELIELAQWHVKMSHPGMKKTETEIKGMIKPA